MQLWADEQTHHFYVFTVCLVGLFIGSELHSRAVRCLRKASAYSPLSTLVPSLIFLLSCLYSYFPLLGGFLMTLLGPLSHLPSCVELVFSHSTTFLLILCLFRRAEVVRGGWAPVSGSWSSTSCLVSQEPGSEVDWTQFSKMSACISRSMELRDPGT